MLSLQHGKLNLTRILFVLHELSVRLYVLNHYQDLSPLTQRIQVPYTLVKSLTVCLVQTVVVVQRIRPVFVVVNELSEV